MVFNTLGNNSTSINDYTHSDQNVGSESGVSTMNEAVIQIARNYATRVNDNRIFFQSTIPAKNLLNAMKSFGVDVPAQDVLVLIDDSFTKNGKDGILITPTALFFRETMEKPRKMELKDIETLFLKEGVSSVTLFINNFISVQISMPAKTAMRQIAEMLLQIIETFHPKVVEKSPTEALKELKDLYDSGIINIAEYEEKRKRYIERL